MIFCRLLTFFKINFFEKFFQEHYRLSNSLDPDQGRHHVGSDLGPNCFQRLSVDDKSPLAREELKESNILHLLLLD